MPTPPRRLWSAVAAVFAGVALLAGCAAPAPLVQPPAAGGAPAPEGLEEFYSQQPEWAECDSNYRCADIEVPLDYEDPGGERITIAVKVFAAVGEPMGSLFVNPGGPGGSGIEMVESIDAYLGSDILRNYDVVGFDPRGVGQSTAVRCYDSAQLEEWYGTEFDVETDAGFQAFVDGSTAYGEACAENTGPLIGHVDTISATRDLDVLRAVVGEAQLTYLGFSYGTFLGAHYAELFPENVGRLVLDGAVDPALGYGEIVRGQTAGFDLAYRSFVEDCQAGTDCPLTGDVESGIDQTVAILEQLADTPVASGDPDRPANDADLMNSIIVSLYNPASWPTLSSAIAALQDGDGSQVRFLSDYALDRDEDGNYPEDQGAFRAIDCLDYPVEVDRDAMRAEAEELTEISRLFGPYNGYGEVGCGTMPVQSTAVREPIAAEGTPPILVIGTTRDPATPYEWAESMADQLSSGVLLTYDGDGHTAYGAGSCIDDAVDDFLVEGTVPDDGLSC
ncbi:alpha/beta hydrolase [Occultella glacieicola]|uniref:Alpha/beta hydrolase n=1 Tax=Occultella glacieicola TaxID=2518684 RepID=A0ABY2E4D3_9MICO|nr:alpha/beta hydrolase [Occultella glacieicola]TDE94277.1 alpha/beta hydrolase [Occultella glacieicola]